MIVCVTAVLPAACAARQPGGLGRYLIRDGEPSLRLILPEEPPRVPGDQPPVPAVDRRPRPKQSLLPTLETSSPELFAALLQAEAVPTAEHHRRVAAIYLRFGITDAAHEHLTRATELDPTDAAAWDARARLWRAWGLAAWGLEDAARAVRLAPASPVVYNTLGTLLHAIGDHEAARAAFEEALALDPGATYARQNLCLVWRETRAGAALPKGGCENLRTDDGRRF